MRAKSIMCGRAMKMIHAAYLAAIFSLLSFAVLPSVYGQTGASFGQAMQARLFGKGPHKYCDKNCSPDDNKVIASANDFAAHHKEFMPSPVNVQAFVTYIDGNKLDPRERKSYEKAYKDLKKEGQLELYSK
jgi:hypothetical protein